MDPLYGKNHRLLQEKFDTTRLADRVASLIVHDKVTAEEKAFIESRDCFFLSTIDHLGRPTCSHTGGDPGFVRVVDEGTLAFPWYDGNGMFYSAGNILGDGKVGILFIDFEHPHRIRLQGTARLSSPFSRRFCMAISSWPGRSTSEARSSGERERQSDAHLPVLQPMSSRLRGCFSSTIRLAAGKAASE